MESPQPKLSPIAFVDDDEFERAIARECYAMTGLTNPWLEYSSGGELLKHLERVQLGLEVMPRLVVCDVNMGQMGGFGLVEAARGVSALGGRPPIVLVSSSVHPRDRTAAFHAGANDYQAKPANIDQYAAFLTRMIAEHGTP